MQSCLCKKGLLQVSKCHGHLVKGQDQALSSGLLLDLLRAALHALLGALLLRRGRRVEFHIDVLGKIAPVPVGRSIVLTLQHQQLQ